MMEELQDDINVLSNIKFETFKTDDCTGCPNKHGTINNKHGTGRRATRGGKGGNAPPSLIKGGHAPPLRNLAPPPVGMVINTQDTNYFIGRMVINTQDTNYSTGGIVINTQDTNYVIRVISVLIVDYYPSDGVISFLRINYIPPMK